jgi:hypothetical protein
MQSRIAENFPLDHLFTFPQIQSSDQNDDEAVTSMDHHMTEFANVCSKKLLSNESKNDDEDEYFSYDSDFDSDFDPEKEAKRMRCLLEKERKKYFFTALAVAALPTKNAKKRKIEHDLREEDMKKGGNVAKENLEWCETVILLLRKWGLREVVQWVHRLDGDKKSALLHEWQVMSPGDQQTHCSRSDIFTDDAKLVV